MTLSIHKHIYVTLLLGGPKIYIRTTILIECSILSVAHYFKMYIYNCGPIILYITTTK